MMASSGLVGSVASEDAGTGIDMAAGAEVTVISERTGVGCSLGVRTQYRTDGIGV